MTSTTFRNIALRAAAPAATLITGLVFAASIAMPATAFAAGFPSFTFPTLPSFPSAPVSSFITVGSTTIAVDSVTGTQPGTVNLTATLMSHSTIFGVSGVPLPVEGQALTFSVDGTVVGTATTTSTGVATLSNVDTSAFTNASTHPITVAFSGSSLFKVGDFDFAGFSDLETFFASFFGNFLTLPSSTGTGTLTISNPVSSTTIYVNANSSTTGDDGTLAHPFHSIQAGIDAAAAGDTVIVYPGSYNETALNRTLTAADGGGTYQFGLFIGTDRDNLKVEGVDAEGNVITSAANVVAHVTTNATNDFGPSGVFVEGSGDTIQGLDIGSNNGDVNKSIEVAGNDFTLADSVLSEAQGGDLYISDFQGAGTNVNKYTVTGNYFTNGATLDIASGAGASAASPVTDRTITGNTFTGAGANYPYALISFDGAGGQPWYVYPVGGAVITGNNFSSGGEGTEYIRTRGTVSNASQFDWSSYWTNNTFDNSVIDLSNATPGSFVVQPYSYSSYTNVQDIGTSIQSELANAQSNDTILVGAGTYAGDITPASIDHLTIQGAGPTTILNVADGYGINLDNLATVTNFALKDVTVNASPTTTYALKAYEATGITLTNDTFNGGTGNTGGGVDFNSTNNVTLNNVTSSGFHKNGFAYTSQYKSSSTAGNDISFDGITASNNGWAGIAFYTTSNSGGAANINGVQFTGTNTVSGNGAQGIFVEGDTDANLGLGATPAYTVTSDGTTLDLTHVAFSANPSFDIVNYQTAPANAIGATFGGLTGAAMSAGQRTTEDGKIEDHLDAPALGLVSYYIPAVVTQPTLLPAPTNLTPVNDATTTDPNFTQTWSTVAGADHYLYQVTDTYDGTTFNSEASDNSTDSNYSISGGTVTRDNSGAPLKSYYWRVAAVAADGTIGNWSPVTEVTVAAVVTSPALTAPVLVDPANDATTTNPAFDNTWLPVAGAANYEYQTSNTDNETAGVLGNIIFTDESDTATNYDLTDPSLVTRHNNEGTPVGDYYWQVRAIDSDGNFGPWSAVNKVTYQPEVTGPVDTTAPTVTVTPDSTNVLHGTETFNITVNDQNPATTTNSHIWVYLYNDGGTQKHSGQSVDLSSGTGTFTVDTTLLDDGTSTIDVGRLQDAAGNWSGAGDNYFPGYVVDNTAPTVTVTPMPADGTLSGHVTFNITVNDAHPTNSANSSIYVYLYNTDGSKSQAQNVDLSNGTGTFTVDTTQLNNGGAYLDVGKLVDGAGNPTQDVNHPTGIDSYFGAYTINNEVAPVADTVPPSVPVLETPANGTTLDTNEFDFTWDPSTDNVAGSITYEFQSSQNPASTTDGVLTSGIWSSGVLSSPTIHSTGAGNGAWYWQVRAIDAAGNTSAWSPVWTINLNKPSDNGGTVTPPTPPTPSAVTDNASDLANTDATLNGTNGDVASEGSSFWVSTSPFVTTSTTLPSGVYSTLDLGPVATDTAYSATLSSLAANAWPSAMPAVTASTTYYYAAWTEVDGTWYPGAVESFSTTGANNGGGDNGGTVTDPSVPTLSSPSNGATVTTSDFPFEWNAPTDNSAVSYEWESSLSDATTTDGSFVNQLGDQTGLTSTMVDSPNTPNNTYFWHVRANNGTGNSAWSDTWSVNVNAAAVVGEAPIAQDITGLTVNENASTTITLMVAHPGTVTYTVTQPTNGTVTQPVAGGADVVYTPNANYTGGDSFTYQAHNGQDSNVATVSITVASSGSGEHENNVPVSSDVTVSSTNDAPVTITLPATDADNDSLTYATTSSPTNGTLSAITGNTVTYTPNANFNSTDTFGFTASDAQSTSTPSTVTINVTAPVAAPTIQSNFAEHGTSGGIIHSSGSTGGSSSQGGTTGSVLGASTYNFTKNLTVGSKGEDVTQLQTILIADGYLTGTPVTGYFGQMTKAAVKLYQAAHQISPVSGFVGPLTRTVLNAGTV